MQHCWSIFKNNFNR